MAPLPLRSLGQIGVITDVNDVDLPPEAVSNARNVRFSEGRITNAHVWRQAALPTGTLPVFSFAVENTNDFDILGYVTKDGKVYHVYNGTQSDVTKSGYATANSTATRTFCTLQGVYYVNQEDRAPWYFNSASTLYANLTNWDSNHRCKALRGFKDYLIALNITKSGTVYSNLVKWSNIALYDAVPDSWDPSDATKSAGENTLAEIQTDILDGLALRNSFVIYATDQAWTAEYTGGPDVFQFYKLYGDRGIINTNCVVEVDGVHYVFDDHDIYIHDGVSPPKSICENRVKKYIFRHLDLAKRKSCFVYHDPAASEVWFCHNSRDSSLKWSGPDIDYCNLAAVYNYVTDSWTFYDLPNVASMAASSWQTAPTYNVSGSYTYDSFGSTYADLVSNTTKSNFALSALDSDVGITSTRILNVDSGIGTSLAFAAVSELAVTPFAKRTGLDLDEMVQDLRAYKNFRSIVPQCTADQSVTLSFKFGGVDFPQQDVEWDDLQEFDPYTEYKVDTRARGRYLSWYFEGENANTYSLSGFDLDMVSVSRR